jgi:hypothetical protein
MLLSFVDYFVPNVVGNINNRTKADLGYGKEVAKALGIPLIEVVVQ